MRKAKAGRRQTRAQLASVPCGRPFSLWPPATANALRLYGRTTLPSSSETDSTVSRMEVPSAPGAGGGPLWYAGSQATRSVTVTERGNGGLSPSGAA